MSNQLFYLATVVLAFLFGAFFAHGEEEPVKDRPVIVKRGGVPAKDLWHEKDVRKYMDLPYLVSLDDIARSLEVTHRLGDYEIVKDPNRPLKQKAWGLDGLSFDLRKEGAIAFSVTIHDYRHWNAMCDKQFENVTTSVDMWSKIPEYYKITKTDKAYIITTSSLNAMQVHFDLKGRFVLGVFHRSFRTVNTPERRIAQMDQVIQRLVELIEATKKREDQSSDRKGADK